MLQMSFNVKPQVIEQRRHDMRVDERVMRYIAIKGRALKSLKSYKARDPRNPLNLGKSTTWH
jgi:ribosomal protein S6